MTNFNTARKHYVYFKLLATRWIDNDIFGHVNNSVYYSYFDTVTNSYLIERGGLDIHSSPVVGFIVASDCQYLSPIKFPMQIDAAFRVNRIGRSSVNYGLAVFPADGDTAAAHGTFTHVFVNRKSSKAVPIPGQIRTALESALVEQPTQ